MTPNWPERMADVRPNRQRLDASPARDRRCGYGFVVRAVVPPENIRRCDNRGSGNYLRASRMLADTVRAAGCHIHKIMSGGSTPDPTNRNQLLAELTSDMAITLQMSAHAMTTAIVMSSGFMIVSVATREGWALSRNAHVSRLRPVLSGSHSGDAGQPFVGQAPPEVVRHPCRRGEGGLQAPSRDAAAAQPGIHSSSTRGAAPANRRRLQGYRRASRMLSEIV